MTGWKLLIAAVLLQIFGGIALAQDRPLLEPLRIGYVQADSIGDLLYVSASLEHAMRRKGFLLSWQTFADGLAVIRSLDSGDIDIALDVSLSDVVAAKRARLKMVFIAELRSIAPSCCDLEQIFADHMFKRFTLSSEYLADHREDVLLILHQEMIKLLQRPPEHQQRSPPRVPVAGRDRQFATIPEHVAPVARDSMQATKDALFAPPSAERSDRTTDITDINYWQPGHD